MINARKIIFRTFGLIIFTGIIIFSYIKYSAYIKGPEINSINIIEFMSINKPSFEIKSTTINTKSVKINNRDITLKDKNNFNEILVFSPGNNIIEIVLEDPFGKTKSYLYNIFYEDNDKNYPKTLKDARERQNIEKDILDKKTLIENN